MFSINQENKRNDEKVVRATLALAANGEQKTEASKTELPNLLIGRSLDRKATLASEVTKVTINGDLFRSDEPG